MTKSTSAAPAAGWCSVDRGGSRTLRGARGKPEQPEQPRRKPERRSRPAGRSQPPAPLFSLRPAPPHRPPPRTERAVLHPLARGAPAARAVAGRSCCCCCPAAAPAAPAARAAAAVLPALARPASASGCASASASLPGDTGAVTGWRGGDAVSRSPPFPLSLVPLHLSLSPRCSLPPAAPCLLLQTTKKRLVRLVSQDTLHPRAYAGPCPCPCICACPPPLILLPPTNC